MLTSSLVGIVVSWFPASAKGVRLLPTTYDFETREHVDEDAVPEHVEIKRRENIQRGS